MQPHAQSAHPARPSAPVLTEAGPPDAGASQEREPLDGLLLPALGGAALWVLTWLAIQLHADFGWALPFLPGVK